MQEIPKLIVDHGTEVAIMLRDDETPEGLSKYLSDRFEIEVQPWPSSGTPCDVFMIKPRSERGRSQFIGWYTHDGVPWPDNHGRRK